MDRDTEIAIPTVLPRCSPRVVDRDYVKDGVEMCGRCSWAKVVCRCDKDTRPLAVKFMADLDEEIRQTQEWDAEIARLASQPMAMRVGGVTMLVEPKLTCRRCHLLPEYQSGLCEPCWEIGRDEAAYDEGLRHEDKNDWGGR